MSDDRLRLLIERAERLIEEEKGIRDDKNDVFKEGASQGYDPKIMKAVIKLRAMNPDDRREMEAVLDLYKSALNLN